MNALPVAEGERPVRLRAVGSLCAAAPALALALAGCAAKLSQDGVRGLFDAADRAFLAGDSTAMCELRTGSFRLDSTHFEIARGRIVADRAEADTVEADAVASGLRTVSRPCGTSAWSCAMRRPASSNLAFILPVRLRRVASGLMIENVRSSAMSCLFYKRVGAGVS